MAEFHLGKGKPRPEAVGLAVTHRFDDTTGRTQAPGRILLETQSNKIIISSALFSSYPVPTCHEAS